MPQRTIAIGDIHGCFAALDALLREVRPSGDDLLIFLGDYVDRGPQSRQVLERLVQLQTECQLIPLLGNHEQMMLQTLEDPTQAVYWLQCGGHATLESYEGSLNNIPDSHLDFLRSCKPYYELEKHFFVHANYDSLLPLAHQPPDLLYWVHLHEQCPLPHLSGKTAIVGHTPQRDGQVLRLDGVICLDTFCVGDRWLTALEVGSGELWQFNRRGEMRLEGPRNINEVPLH